MNEEELKSLLKGRNGLNFHLKNPIVEDTMLKQTLFNNDIYNLNIFTSPKPVIDFKVSNLLQDYTANYYINKFTEELNNDPSFVILVDNDADGFCSAALLSNYLRRFTPNIEYVFSEGKTHGLSRSVMDKLLEDSPEMLLIPDAASNDLSQLNELSNNGIKYLVIDHHDFNNERKVVDNFMPIISNQYSTNDGFINNNFTGVGMVYMFVRSIDEILKTDYASELLYYFAVGQVGDVSDVSDLEIRYLMLRGFKQIKSNELLKLNVDIDNISAHELSFSIIPKINAVCRTGSIKDKQELMKSLSNSISKDLKIEVKVKKKSKEDNKFHQVIKPMSFAEYENRNLNSIQSKQKRGINKAMKNLVNIKQNNMFAFVIDENNNVSPSSAGLLATKIASKLQKPTLVLHPDSKNFCLLGSGRGVVKVMPDFRSYCSKSGLFNFATGHGNAFGASINRDNLDKFFDLVEDEETNNEVSYDIDCVYINEAPGINEIISFDKYRNLFGGEVKEPRLGFVGIKVPTNSIWFRGSMLTLKIYGISFVMFSCPDILKADLESISGRYAYFDIYGSPTINRFMSGEFPQIVISDIKLSDPIIDTEEENDDILFDF